MVVEAEMKKHIVNVQEVHIVKIFVPHERFRWFPQLGL